MPHEASKIEDPVLNGSVPKHETTDKCDVKEPSNTTDRSLDFSQSEAELKVANQESSPEFDATKDPPDAKVPQTAVQNPNSRIPEGLDELNFDFSDSEDDEDFDDEEEKMRKNEERRLSQSIKDILGPEYQVANSPRQLPPLGSATGQRRRSGSISSSQEDPLSPRQKPVLKPIGRDFFKKD